MGNCKTIQCNIPNLVLSMLDDLEVRYYGICNFADQSNKLLQHNCIYIRCNVSCTANLYIHKNRDTSVQATKSTKTNTAMFNSVKAVYAF
jgi:coproporphyrinogen III oxidase-like Fe-S oxidoreductase